MITYYVNTASSAGGTGVTNATSGAARAFATMQEAATVLIALNAPDDVQILCCGALVDRSAPAFSGVYVQAGFTLYIRGNPTDPNGKHSGVWNANRYRLQDAPAGGAESLLISSATAQIFCLQDFQIVCDAAAPSTGVYCNTSLPAASRVKIDRCLFRSVNGFAFVHFRQGILEMSNCACGAVVPALLCNAGVFLNTSAVPIAASFYNCQLRHCGTAITTGVGGLSVLDVVNCQVFDNVDDFNGGGPWAIDHCASDDGDGTNPVAVPSWDAEFVNPGYRLTVDGRLAYGAVCLGAGVGPGVNPAVPLVDIVGGARAGAVCSVGPFERYWGVAATRLDYRFLRTDPVFGLVDAGDGVHSVQAP